MTGMRLDSSLDTTRRIRPPAGPGFTLVEMVVVAGLTFLVLGAAYTVFTGGIRADRAARVTSAIHGAVLIQEFLARDLRRLAVPYGAVEAIRVSTRSVTFYQARFQEGDPLLRLAPVRYRLESTRGGNHRLVKEEFEGGQVRRQRALAQVILRDLTFRLANNLRGSGRFLVATGTVLSDDVAPSRLRRSDKVGSFPVVFLGEVLDRDYLGGQLTATAGIEIDGELPPLPEDPESGEPGP